MTAETLTDGNSTPTTGQPPVAPALGCNYWHKGTTLECRGDGYLWDADDDGYDPDDQSSPCPECNTHQYLLSAKEEAEGVLESSSHRDYFTGTSLWESAVKVARAANELAAQEALRLIAEVHTSHPDATGEDGVGTQVFKYAPDFVFDIE